MNSKSTHTSQVSGLALLIKWANGQNHSVRQLTADVIGETTLVTDPTL